MAKKGMKWEFRDVSSGFQKIREFLLGRKYVFHNRFPALLSPRSLPPPDIPRGPDYKYSDQWYVKRHVLDSVKPPVVAPVAEGRPKGKGYPCASKKGDSAIFNCPPTPGMPWWFDGHCYYEFVATKCPEQQPSNPCQPPPSKKCPPPCPEKKKSPPPCTPPPKPCDPCKPPPQKPC